jgi:hypothetical protein
MELELQQPRQPINNCGLTSTSHREREVKEPVDNKIIKNGDIYNKQLGIFLKEKSRYGQQYITLYTSSSIFALIPLK